MSLMLLKRADGLAFLLGALPPATDDGTPVDVNRALADEDTVDGEKVKDWPVGMHDIADDAVLAFVDKPV